MKNFFNSIDSFLPLVPSTILWDSPNLNISGANWSFYTSCAWRIIDKEKMICGCEDLDTAEILNLLVDIEIVKIFPQSKNLSIDPVFVFSNGYKLELFSTTYFEPWTFALPQDPVYVASPSDPGLI